MNIKYRHVVIMMLIILAGAFNACSETDAWDGSLEDLLRSQPERFGTVMQDPEKHRVQVIYTQIDRDAANQPSFTSFSYRVNAGEYFYPASTVKLPTALLTLEKLNHLNVEGLDRDTTMLTGAAVEPQIPATIDASAKTGLPSIGHYIRKILLVSDNDAFNRLYEFVGQESLNTSLQRKGYVDTRIMHRLETVLSVEQNRHTNPVSFLNGDEVVYEQAPQYSGTAYVAAAPIMLGKAEVVGDNLLQGPKNFAEKNAFPLQGLHDVLKALMFPESVDVERKFDLTSDDYEFMYRNMASYPRNSGIKDYSDANDYPDGFVKFLMFGGGTSQIPTNIRIFNKVGDAYGFLTDAAYIVDLDNNIEFILAATVYTNANETFNDNNYEYSEIGLPFLRELGEAIYEIEVSRPREHVPDLSRYRFSE